MMNISRRQLLASLSASLAWGTSCRRDDVRSDAGTAQPEPRPIRQSNGNVDWRAVRDLFPLAADSTHMASFLLVSHPKPVAEAIERFRRKIDADPGWIEQAAFS